jgi:hypothetical protein
MSQPTLFTRCPACGGALFMDVLVRFGAPINRLLPVYLTGVVLDEHAVPVLWDYQGGTLDRALDFDADGFEDTTDPMLYCEEYHPVRALVLAHAQLATRTGEATAASSRTQVLRHASVTV